MRIVHLTPHLPPDQAANAILPAQLGTWMSARGHDVLYLAHPPRQGGTPSAPDAGAVTWVPRRIREGWLGALRLDALSMAAAYTRVLDEVADGADVMHLHSNGLLIETGARWARRRRIPTLLTLYGTEIWHFRPRRPIDFFRRAYMQAAGVTFYSQGLLDRAKELGLSRPNLLVAYPAVSDAFTPHDAEARAALRRELGLAEARVIVNVKRLHELAGQTYLLQAFAHVLREMPDTRLVICGTGELRESLQAQAAHLEIAHKVTFTGLIPNDLVARYVAAADVFALPSLLEALPTVAVEALAAGTPVVSADHPGGVELHGLFGEDVMVVGRRDIEALAAALLGALHPTRRVNATTLTRLHEHFGPRAIADQYDALYRGMLPS
jgi:glycosyltransferase involved in cell wall biosynthesis